MGEPWHDDGMLLKKKNTFFDFIDCAEFLVKEKWTSKDRLVIEGGSAGAGDVRGLLGGAHFENVLPRPSVMRLTATTRDARAAAGNSTVHGAICR